MSEWFIYKDVLESIMEFSKTFFPKEFSAMLLSKQNIFQDIYIIPHTLSSTTSAVIRLEFVPLSKSINGSVHSHPSGKGMPSFADLSFFQTKDVNLITYPPFELFNFKAYDFSGKEVILKVISRENDKVL